VIKPDNYGALHITSSFELRRTSGTAVFLAALVGEAVVGYLFLYTKISFLWYNVFGCLTVVFSTLLLSFFFPKGDKAEPATAS
jgi:hypothetical protein